MTSTSRITAQASPNIALIKYWGDHDHAHRIPANASLSMTLGGLHTTTLIELDPSLKRDELKIDDRIAPEPARQRASDLLSLIRHESNRTVFANIESKNNFPMGAGIASSASAFAALSLAGCAVYGLDRDQRSLSRIARRASGSAARSICAGFVALHTGETDQQAFAETLFSKDHWDLVDVVAVVDKTQKMVSSSDGHRLANTSPLQTARVTDAPRRFEECIQALEKKDFERLAHVVELDSNLMHAVMMSSNPPLLYWQPETIQVMQAVIEARSAGLEVCYTIDAGPNVHCLCSASSMPQLKEQFESLDILEQIFVSFPGSGAMLL